MRQNACIQELNWYEMPRVPPHYYVGRLPTQNGVACHRSREPRSSGFVHWRTEFYVGGAPRAGLEESNKNAGLRAVRQAVENP